MGKPLPPHNDHLSFWAMKKALEKLDCTIHHLAELETPAGEWSEPYVLAHILRAQLENRALSMGIDNVKKLRAGLPQQDTHLEPCQTSPSDHTLDPYPDLQRTALYRSRVTPLTARSARQLHAQASEEAGTDEQP